MFLSQPHPNDAIYQESQRVKKINEIVDGIWEKYDADGNGSLDKEETWKLAQETMGMLNTDAPIEIQRQVFDELFAQIDKDNSGRIVKVEMAHFVKKFVPFD